MSRSSLKGLVQDTALNAAVMHKQAEPTVSTDHALPAEVSSTQPTFLESTADSNVEFSSISNCHSTDRDTNALVDAGVQHQHASSSPNSPSTSVAIPESIVEGGKQSQDSLDDVHLQPVNVSTPTIFASKRRTAPLPESPGPQTMSRKHLNMLVSAIDQEVTRVTADLNMSARAERNDTSLADPSELVTAAIDQDSPTAPLAASHVGAQEDDCMTGLPHDGEWVIEKEHGQRDCPHHGLEYLILFEERWLSPASFGVKNAHSKLKRLLEKYRKEPERANIGIQLECDVDNLWDQMHSPVDVRRDEMEDEYFKIRWKLQWITQENKS